MTVFNKFSLVGFLVLFLATGCAKKVDSTTRSKAPTGTISSETPEVIEYANWGADVALRTTDANSYLADFNVRFNGEMPTLYKGTVKPGFENAEVRMYLYNSNTGATFQYQNPTGQPSGSTFGLNTITSAALGEIDPADFDIIVVEWVGTSGTVYPITDSPRWAAGCLHTSFSCNF